MQAVILILKHATFLRLSNLSPESALTHVELVYRHMNMDLKIQQHLTASQEHSVDQFVSFIMSTEIGLSVPTSVRIISHQAFSAISIYLLSGVEEYHKE